MKGDLLAILLKLLQKQLKSHFAPSYGKLSWLYCIFRFAIGTGNGKEN